MRRRIAIPFVVSSGKITTLQDLKRVLAESPEELIIPLQDGRLERFLRGMGNRYLAYIDKSNPENSLKKLAEIFGIEISKELKVDNVSVVTSVEDLIKAINEGRKEINIAKGRYFIDKIMLKSSVRLIGQGKNETLLKIKELFAFCEFKLSNITCEVERFISSKEPEIKESSFFSSEKLSIATSADELLELLKKDHREIWIGEGIFSINEAKVSYTLIGAGKDKTYLKFNRLFASHNTVLKNLSCDTELLISPTKVKLEDAYLNYKRQISEGELVWKFKTEGPIDSPAIGNDGTIYVGSNDWYLYAINPDGSLKWKFETGDWVKSSPAIGNDGTIYVGSNDRYLYAINPDGSLKWKFKTGDCISSSPAIGNDGTIYVGSDDGYLYAINLDGSLKWKFETGDWVLSSPAIGNDGTIYVGSNNGYLYAINPNGSLKWKFKTGNWIQSSPAIGNDGTIYVGSNDGYLYAFYTTSFGCADSEWPMFRHDVRHTGRLR